MSEIPELLPCPFCGAAPVTERTGFSGRALYIYCINDNGCPRPKAVGETAEKAAENWNTRAPRKAHKVMTPEEYAAMPVIGWHEVCRDVDGFSGVGVRFLGDVGTLPTEGSR